MFLETVRSEGLSHLSYIIGSNGKAAVIDPRRDCHIYVDIAANHDAQITHIFETHCNEDIVSGSVALGQQTKARIFYGNLMRKYGEIARDGQTFEVGDIALKILETPGHTPSSISIVLLDKSFNNMPVGVFTGDTLLIGDAGRADLYAAMKDEMAGKLYDSIHKKILPLGDHVIMYPAHGEGVSYSANVAARDFSTLGYERQFSPVLRKSRKEFIKSKLAEEHYFVPYFRHTKKFNLEGMPPMEQQPYPVPEDAEGFATAIIRNNMTILDVRSPEAFAGAHIPESLSIPLDRVPTLAGWFLSYDKKIGIVANRNEDIVKARLYLMRMGFDNVVLYLTGGMRAWYIAEKPISSIPIVSASTKQASGGEGEELFWIDVCNRAKGESGGVSVSRKIWVGDLPDQIVNLPRNRKIVTYCDSGRHAITAASLLKQAKFDNVYVCLGTGKCCEKTSFMREDAMEEMSQ